jgi:hypothetical protein
MLGVPAATLDEITGLLRTPIFNSDRQAAPCKRLDRIVHEELVLIFFEVEGIRCLWLFGLHYAK